MKAKLGRPPKPKDQIRKPFSLRLTPAESKAINSAANKAGLGPSEFGRKALLYVVNSGIGIT